MRLVSHFLPKVNFSTAAATVPQPWPSRYTFNQDDKGYLTLLKYFNGKPLMSSDAPVRGRYAIMDRFFLKGHIKQRILQFSLEDLAATQAAEL